MIPKTSLSRAENTEKSRVPAQTLLEQGLPVEALYELAKREGNSKKPIYEIHKWWARRLGHVFRMLLIASTLPRTQGKKENVDRKLMKRFYEKNDLSGVVVLDPFMGGGTSVVEALKCGATVVGVDIDPVAWFISKKEVEPLDESKLNDAYRIIERKLSSELRKLYRTTDPATGEAAEIVNAFWVSSFQCPECDARIVAHPHFQLAYDKKNQRQIVFCKSCGEVHEIAYPQRRFKCKTCAVWTTIQSGRVERGKVRCDSCKNQANVIDLIKPGIPATKSLFAIEFSKVRDGKPIREFKRADELDLQVVEEGKAALQQDRPSLFVPGAEIFTNDRFDGRPITHGYSKYEQLFNPRQLYCLSLILREIIKVEDVSVREYLLLAFSDCLASNNELVSYAFGYRKVTPLFAIHGFQVPQRPVEGNVWGNEHFGRGTFSRCVKKLIAGKRYSRSPFEYRYSEAGKIEKVFTGESIESGVWYGDGTHDAQIHRARLLNQSSSNLERLDNRSIDLILTDPPFYNNLAYSELSDFYFQWLRPHLESLPGGYRGETTPVGNTLLVKRKTEPEHSRYLEGLTLVMAECSRLLKEDGMLVFTFHHRDPAAWHALSAAIRDNGFRVTSVSPVRAEGVSGFHSYEGTPKWDAVISCRHRTNGRLEPRYSSTERISDEVRTWTKRFQRVSIPWGAADESSFAFALMLRGIVNGKLADGEARESLREIAKLFPQKGISGSIPAIA
jgi:adenine-specific DNA methylase